MEESEAIEQQISSQERGFDMDFLGKSGQSVQDSILGRHLEPLKLLKHIEMLLMGYSYDNNSGEWIPVTFKARNEKGNVVDVEQGPLMSPNYVRMSIGYLKVFLNSNTNLSYLEEMDQVNAIMWDVNVRLTRLLHPLKKIYDRKEVEMIYGILEQPIYFALLRGYKKISLDAMTKMQHSIEHLSNIPKGTADKPKEKFKLFGI